jgi:nucleoside 2-deoxyribosyltransferase
MTNTNTNEKTKIYVASSWRNTYQPRVVEILRGLGFEVYDFKNPGPGDHGFSWREIDPDWKNWSPQRYREALLHPIAARGHESDMAALDSADICVLVLPSGRSASWEYGYHCGKTGKPGVVYMPESCEPELMYRGSLIAATEGELIEFVAKLALER